LLRSKDETLEIFKHCKSEVENQLDKKIKVIRNDIGEGYKTPFNKRCYQNGIIYQITVFYSPQQNDIS
jgi:hypothetical protein